MSVLFNFFIERWRLALSMSIFAIIAGSFGILQMNKQAYPSVNTGSVVITTVYPGSSAIEVKNEVSRIIEDQLKEVDGLKDVTSVSQNGLSRIIIRVDIDEYDYKLVFDDIQKAVDKAGPLPSSLLDKPQVLEIKSDEIPILKIAIQGPHPGRGMDALAKTLKDDLELLDDVARVDLAGYSEREYQILLDPEQLSKFHISIPEVVRSIQNTIKDIPAGDIISEKTTTLVRVTGKSSKIDDLMKTVVRSNFNGQSIRISDIGTILDTSRDKDVLVEVDGKSSISATVVKKSASDTVKTVESIKPRLERFEKRLPESFSIKIYDNESERVQAKLGIAMNNAFIGFILVAFFLLIFFPNLAGVFTALSLPLVVMMTMGLIPYLGADFNNVTLLAIIISLGLLVDNSIVIGENYIRLRESGLTKIEAAKKGVAQFWLAITATSLTTIAAFVPMLVTKGVMGDFLKFIPYVVTVALAASLFESFILLPARLRFTMKSSHQSMKDTENDLNGLYVDQGWFGHIQRFFEKILSFGIRFRYFVVVSIGFLISGAIYVQARFNYFDVFPKNDVEIYFGRFETSPGASMQETLSLAKRLEQNVLSSLQASHGKGVIKHSVITIGHTQDSAFDAYANFGDHTGSLSLTLPREFAQKIKVNEILSTIRNIRPEGIQELSWTALAEGPPVGKALEITLVSNDPGQLMEASKLFKDELSLMKGVFDINDSFPEAIKEINFEVDQEKIAGSGLSLNDLGFALRSTLEGTWVSSLNIDGESVDVRVRYKDSARTNAELLGEVTIPNPRGYLVPAKKVARISESTNIPKITRYQFQDSVTVTAEVDNIHMTSVDLNIKANGIKDKIREKFPDIAFATLGQDESTRESVGSLMTAMFYAALAIFLILVFIFNSFLKPLLVLSAVPLSLVGTFLAFALHGIPLSFFALVGIVGLAGVVINGAIILISFIEDLKREGNLQGKQLLARAASARLRPVLVTTLTTVGGLMPTAYGLGGHDATLKPLALAMGWGLISGTILILMALPPLLAVLDDFTELFLRFFRIKPRYDGTQAQKSK